MAAVTSTRADFGLLRWTLRRLSDDPEFELQLLVTGSHLASEFGRTVTEVEASGLPVAAKVEILGDSDSRLGTAESMGRALLGLAPVLERLRPDLLLLLGDRFEIFSAGAAATALRIPIAHLCGGEKTEGAIDQVWRDGLTKMAHVHLVATEAAAGAVRALGEDDCRIHVVGSPGLESFRHMKRPAREELSAELGIGLRRPVVLVTFHPVTNPQAGEPDDTVQLRALLDALGDRQATLVFTSANADTGGRALNALVEDFARGREATLAVPSLGSDRYVRLMLIADAMCGNSSSALIEAPSARLPAVNVGSRQRGRLRAANVIDVEPDAALISGALDRALDPAFRSGLRGLRNPYGDGRTSRRVTDILRSLELSPALMSKR